MDYRTEFIYLGTMKRSQSRIETLSKHVSRAVAHYWRTRNVQSQKQAITGKTDQGARGAVTGGAQMDGFITLITDLIVDAGAKRSDVYHDSKLELPGYFRPTKEWDLLLVKDGELVIALEAKSQVGPSFGNNFNNRTEEAMGSALDLWTAYRDGAYNKTVKPWLGYIFMLEDCPGSRRPVRVKEPHFKVFPEFVDASYARRYEIFCRKLMRENYYTVATFLMSEGSSGLRGHYSEPADDLQFDNFARSLIAQVKAFGVTNRK